LTTIGRSTFTEHATQNNKDLNLGWGGQFDKDNNGKGHWFLCYIGILIFQNGIVAKTKKTKTTPIVMKSSNFGW
jgi:hypothetical protein